MHSTMMKQGKEIKNLALKNQELEHKLQLQDIRVQQQEKEVRELRDILDQQTTKVQDTLTTHEEKMEQINVSKNVGP